MSAPLWRVCRGLAASPRALTAVAREAATSSTRRAAGRSAHVRSASEWLQSKPPQMNVDAGTVAAFYYRAVRDYDLPTKDCVAAVGQDERLTHGTLDKHTYAYALGLVDALGVTPGAKVALWLHPGELEAAVLQYAVALAGGVSVCIDARAGFDAVLRVLAEEGVRVLVLSPRFGSEDRAAALATVFADELARAAVEGGTEPLTSKRFRALKFLVTTGGERVDGVVRLKDIPVYGVGGEHDFDAVAAIQTSVLPGAAASVSYVVRGDGALHRAAAAATNADVVATAAAAARAMRIGSGDVVAVTAPLGTHFGFAAGFAAANGVHAKIVLAGKAFDASAALAAMTAQSATALVATAEQAAALSAALADDAAKPAGKRKFDVSTLRTGLVGVDGPAVVPATLGAATLRPVALAKLPAASAFL